MRCALSLLLLLSPVLAAAEDGGLPEDSGSVSLSVDGSAEAYGGAKSGDIRAGLEFEFASAMIGSSVLDWSLELYYSYSHSDTDGEVSTANSLGLDIAKISLSRLAGTDFQTVKPYLLAGAELTRLRERNEEDEMQTYRFMAPTAGAGLEFRINSRVSLTAEYRQNLAGGERRMASTSLGLSWAVFGGREEEE